MMLVTERVDRSWSFEANRTPGCEWPDLPWPCWKPNTGKLMRPDIVTFTITARDNDAPRPGNVYAHGPRVTGGGASLGHIVDNEYYSNSDMPEFLGELTAKAIGIVELAIADRNS